MDPSIEPSQIRQALAKICASEEFNGSARLRALFTYVVEETLAGRADAIRAKTIGLDVHKYSTDEIAEREGVVRVDAGRVRRKLEEYYTRGGVFDPVRISLPVGRYVPNFEKMALASETEPNTPAGRPMSAIVLVAAACALTVATTVYALQLRKGSGAITEVVDTNRGDIFDISPTRVEAVNLAGIGRDLVFPAVDRKRLSLALDVFLATIEKDDTYYGGYAGAAQVHATFAVLAPNADVAADALVKSEDASQRALRLGPETAWALSAAAWVQFAANKRDAAVELSHRAFEIAPLDPHVAEFDALISLYQSDFERIFQQARARETTGGIARNHVFHNVLGAAHFHTGNHQAAIDTFEDAVASGAPFGPIAVGYLAAAHQAIGQTRDAAAFARLLEKTWPSVKPDAVQRRLFLSAEPAGVLAKHLHAAAAGNDG